MTSKWTRIEQIKHSVRMYSKMVADNAMYGASPSRTVGKGHDFADLREYTRSDDARDIDWKSSLRTGTLLVKQYTVEKERRVLIATATGANMAADTSIGEDKTQLAVEIAGSIAYLVRSYGDRFAFAYGTPTGLSISEFRNGMDFLERNLAGLERSCGQPNSWNIDNIADHISHSVQKKIVLIIIADLDGLLSISERTAKRLAGEDDFRVVLIEDAYLMENGAYDVEGQSHLPYMSSKKRSSLLQMEINERIRKTERLKQLMKRCGVPVVSIKASSEIPEMMMDLFEDKRRR